ncbi:hypothetical protein CHS0354_023144 [Potamilus streckersoni]|uniref:Uncharacterized protein n=1 Tax=Potamilus streckersoni TaxID=2493646 RepID=A0AAE0RN69_9BIVA|nr:hypothetical protein CHS0354_023144 [Potamilus streckersoni]
MDDIEALSLLKQENENITPLSKLPENSEDRIEMITFQDNCRSIIRQAVETITAISKYTNQINSELKQLQMSLNNSTKTFQKRIKDILSRITIRREQSDLRPTSSGREHLGILSARERTSVQNEPNTSKEAKNIDAREMMLVQLLENIEEEKQNLRKSIVLTQIIINDIDKNIGATKKDVENLNGSINGWMSAEKNKKTEEQSKRQERRSKSAYRGQRRNKQYVIRIGIQEKQEKKEEKDRKEKEYEEAKIKEEERRLKEEEERKKREEEERNKKWRKRGKEDEDRKRKDEEEKRLKEEAERRQREDEEERHRKEEEERKRHEKEKQKREEEERRRKQEKERKRIEEENRKRDPANWKLIEYKQLNEQTNAFNQGVCCKVAAMDNILAEKDLECLASDEWREENNGSLINVDEKLASSIIRINSRSGEKTFPVNTV